MALGKIPHFVTYRWYDSRPLKTALYASVSLSKKWTLISATALMAGVKVKGDEDTPHMLAQHRGCTGH